MSRTHWYHEGSRGVMSHMAALSDPRYTHQHGRVYEVEEFSTISFSGNFTIRNFYRVVEHAIFDHIRHARELRVFRSEDEAKRYIAKRRCSFTLAGEVVNARAGRIAWMERELPKAERNAKRAAQVAARSTYTLSRHGKGRKRMPKTAEHIEQHAAKKIKSQRELRQLKINLRRAIKLQTG